MTNKNNKMIKKKSKEWWCHREIAKPNLEFLSLKTENIIFQWVRRTYLIGKQTGATAGLNWMGPVLAIAISLSIETGS